MSEENELRKQEAAVKTPSMERNTKHSLRFYLFTSPLTNFTEILLHVYLVSLIVVLHLLSDCGTLGKRLMKKLMALSTF